MASVLVTGGAGVIGSWVSRTLVERGIRAVIYSRHPNPSLLKDIADKVDFVAGEVLDLPTMINTIKRFNVERIIHMATALHNLLDANPYMGYRVNVDGTMNVLEAARLMGIKRLIYTSTMGVYAPPEGEYAYPTYKPIDEDYPKAPNTIYGATKFFGENMVLSYNRIYCLDVVILRFALVYGPEKQARHGPLAIHSRIIESAMLDKPLKIPQGREEKDDMIYARDVANGIVLACFAENLQHRVFHLGTGVGRTFQELGDILNKIYGKILIEIGPGLNPMVAPWGASSYCVFNIERAKKELGFNPQYDLETGTKDYIETMKRLDIKPMVF